MELFECLTNENMQNVKFYSILTTPLESKFNKKIILWVNQRLVRSDSMDNLVNKIYSEACLNINKKEFGYFCFIQLEIHPNLLDFNLVADKS